MREVKFRAWGKQDEECREVGALRWGGPSGRLGTLYTIDPVAGDSLSVFGPAEAFVLEQYTGLKDKKDNAIYEGDIVCFGNVNYPMLVVWHKTAFRLKNSAGIGCPIAELELCEIIGNIHENPELLEVSEEGK